ncbi:hypothetical protein EAF04_010252 [Stromatinia cepivora]|nr:hypothetical protein EAF04_010252 [Stromatinia cepivora]
MSQRSPYTTKENPFFPQTNTLDNQHLINMNIKKHEFFYNAEENSANEEDLSDGESSDEEVECQACHGDITKVLEVAVLHPCNHTFHFARCIKNRFRKNPKCPVCGTEVVKLRRMRSREGSFYDLLAPKVKKQSANEFPTPNLIPQYSGFSKVTKRNFKNDPGAEHQIRLWIRREIQALAYFDQNCHQLLTRMPNEKADFEFCVGTFLQMKKRERKATLRGLKLFLGTYTDVFLHELEAFLMSRYQTLEEWDRNVKYTFYQPGSPTQTSSTQEIPSQATPTQATPTQATPRLRPGLYRSSGLLSRYRGRGSDSILVLSRAQSQAISNVPQEKVQQTAEESLTQNEPHTTEYSLGSELPQAPGSTFDAVTKDEGALDADLQQVIVNSLSPESPRAVGESLVADSPRNAEEVIATPIQEITEGTLNADDNGDSVTSVIAGSPFYGKQFHRCIADN